MNLPPLPARPAWATLGDWTDSDIAAIEAYTRQVVDLALEYAALVCEGLPTKEGFHSAFRCAIAVRALKGST